MPSLTTKIWSAQVLLADLSLDCTTRMLEEELDMSHQQIMAILNGKKVDTYTYWRVLSFYAYITQLSDNVWERWLISAQILDKSRSFQLVYSVFVALMLLIATAASYYALTY